MRQIGLDPARLSLNLSIRRQLILLIGTPQPQTV